LVQVERAATDTLDRYQEAALLRELHHRLLVVPFLILQVVVDVVEI
jgi:hypothetical protein